MGSICTFTSKLCCVYFYDSGAGAGAGAGATDSSVSGAGAELESDFVDLASFGRTAMN